MQFQTLLVTEKDHVFHITLNRPEALNTMNQQLVAELTQALEHAQSEEEIRVVVLTGAGRAFCAGADLKEGTPGMRRGPGSAEAIRRELRKAQAVSYLLQSLEKPTMALVNGPAVGGGMDWALACDLRIGCEHTRFVIAFPRIGLFPGTGGTWLLSRLVGIPKAAELLFTGDALEAEEAHRLGLLNKLVPAHQLESEGMALAQRIAQGAPIAMRLAKIQLYGGLQMDFKSALEAAAAYETITLTSEDHKEGVAAFREKRTPRFAGK